MKRMVCLSILVAMGGLVLAQSPVANNAPAAGAGGAPAVAPVPAATAVGTNAITGRPDGAKIQALFAEFSSIRKELLPHEELIKASDPELKALDEKQAAAKQVVMELEKQRRDLLDKKLSADPALAPRVARRQEIQQTLNELRPSMSGMRDNPMGGGPRSRMMMPSPEGKVPEMAPKVVPSPAPTTDKPVEQPK